MNTYKIIYKKGNIRYHDRMKAESIDDLAFLIRYREGRDAFLIQVIKEE